MLRSAASSSSLTLCDDHSVLFEWHYFPPVTELKVLKILEKITSELLADALLFVDSLAPECERVPAARVSRDTLQHLSASCLGDVRCSLPQLLLSVN